MDKAGFKATVEKHGRLIDGTKSKQKPRGLAAALGGIPVNVEKVPKEA